MLHCEPTEIPALITVVSALLTSTQHKILNAALNAIAEHCIPLPSSERPRFQRSHLAAVEVACLFNAILINYHATRRATLKADITKCLTNVSSRVNCREELSAARNPCRKCPRWPVVRNRAGSPPPSDSKVRTTCCPSAYPVPATS